MTEAVLVSVRDEAGIGPCDELFREYGEWSTQRLSHEHGIFMSADDLESAHALFRAEWPNLFGPRGRLYLATVGGEPAGVGALKPVSAETGELKRMFVRPRYRRTGIGRRILERLVDDARELGYRELRLETMTYMQEAHELYRSMGFVEMDSFDAEGATFGLAICELFMVLSL